MVLDAATNDPFTSPEMIDALVRDPRRVVAMEAVHNFRDLGGYELGDGRVTRFGKLFRSDGLYRATDQDIETFDALGLRTVIDLRSSGELDQNGVFPVDRHPVGFHHLPILDATWMQSDRPTFSDDERGTIDFLVWAYRQMLDHGGDQLAHAMQVLVVPESMPAVFHCAAGKDRTGVLTALILGALGVHDEVIVADYALTLDGMDRMRAWVEQHHPEMKVRMGETPAFMLAAHPQAMREVLAGLRSEYGSIGAFVDGLGVGPAALADLADQLAT